MYSTRLTTIINRRTVPLLDLEIYHFFISYQVFETVYQCSILNTPYNVYYTLLMLYFIFSKDNRDVDFNYCYYLYFEV